MGRGFPNPEGGREGVKESEGGGLERGGVKGVGKEVGLEEGRGGVKGSVVWKGHK